MSRIAQMIVLDQFEQEELIQKRIDSGSDRYDEVWDGVYIVSPLPNDEHQEIVGDLCYCFIAAIKLPGLGKVRPGVNISDLEDQWEHNHRGPDIAVFLNNTTARNLGTHWLGGPDFVVEVISWNDRSREKLDFYGKVGTREVLLVDRFPWRLELYRLCDGELSQIGTSTLEGNEILRSEVLPLSFRLIAGESRPIIEVCHNDGLQRWSA
jgi:Uma2 family endonuclease